MLHSTCVPFRIPNVYGGLAEVQGLLKSAPEGLILDFEMKESFFDLLNLDTKVVRIPLTDITHLEMRKGWFRRWIVVSVNRLEALRQIPGSKGGEIRLRIPRKDTVKAEEFVLQFQMALTTHDLRRLMDNERP